MTNDSFAELETLMDSKDEVIKGLKNFDTPESFITVYKHDLVLIKNLKSDLDKWFRIAGENQHARTFIIPGTLCVLIANIWTQEWKKEGKKVATKSRCERCPLWKTAAEKCGNRLMRDIIFPAQTTLEKQEKEQFITALNAYEEEIKTTLNKLKLEQKSI